MPPGEEVCTDLYDDDQDGLVDCQDPTHCQPTETCEPGATPTGGPCTENSDCHADARDPLCLSEWLFLLPQGYCSEFCDVGANDCATGAFCVEFIFPTGGICIDSCQTHADCRPGYACQDFGLGSPICWVGDVCGDGAVTGDEQCDPPDGVTCNDYCRIIQPPGSCDNTGTCGDYGSGCIACAEAGNCAAPLDACSYSDDCREAVMCMEPCGWNQACIDECVAQYPEGAALYDDLVNCILCEECPNDCADAPAPDPIPGCG
jgi:hypothetical protein